MTTARPLPDFQREIASALASRDFARALAACADCRRAWPDSPAGWLLGSIVLLQAGRPAESLALVDERLDRSPGDFGCLLQRAECLYALGRRPEAVAAGSAAMHAAGQDANALQAVGSFLAYAREHARAREAFDAALGAAPGRPDLLKARAVLSRFLGDFERAVEDFEAALAAAPGDADCLVGLAELRTQTKEQNRRPQLEAALAVAEGDDERAVALHFALAKTLDDLGEYDAGWRHLSLGNTVERRRFRYEPATDAAVVDALVAAFPAAEPLGFDSTGERPIFVVGLPRTGTTMVERILGSHSQVHPAGELPALSEAISAVLSRSADVAALDWAEYASRLSGVRGDALAGEYLARAASRRGARPRFCDKQTSNFYYCPLILRAFPNATIVHVTRHPLAACFAIYRTRFNGTFPFSYDLDELAAYYAGYRRLMAHWHAVLPGRIVDVAYEDVVGDQEATTRRLLDAAGLPFEPACLEFHRNAAAVTTASAVQVRRPLYDSSLAHWRHYARGLAPLAEKLAAAGIAVD